MKKIIELKSISKSFDGEPVLDSISLDIHDNEFITLLGPSGCGKTTTLRIIGGFETPDEGDVIFMGERINDVPPHKRHVNTVFQKYALFPHLNVFENVAFPLRERKVAQGADPGKRQPDAGHGHALGLCPPAGHKPFRRPAAAGGHRPGAGQRAEGSAAG